ncbi:MAG TPA: methyl-accepting chemotaxis protein [Arenicellales bacterium]|nr:methyl-accepting chemotaxis protein [Arenicellales bacterium]
MFNKLRIGPRLILLILVQTALILAVGVIGLLGLNQATQSTNQLNASVTETALVSDLADAVQGELLPTVHGVNNGTITWADGQQRLQQAATRFYEGWDRLTASVPESQQDFIDDVLAPWRPGVEQAIDELIRLFDAEDRVNLSLFVRNELDDLVQPFVDSLVAATQERQFSSSQVFAESLRRGETFFSVGSAVVVLGVILASALGVVIYRSISEPVRKLSETVTQIGEGNYEQRAGLQGRNELAELGTALDELLADKVTTMARAEEENERLNDSVVRLLEGVSRLSQRDLTVTLPVSQDVTGPVADAMNLMTEETSRVLMQVAGVAEQVESASSLVNEKAEAVDRTEGMQREEIERTVQGLEEASRALQNITQLARNANTAAEETRNITHQAMQTVQNNLAGMNEIREAIQETGKRLKRLGERTNEISNVVDIINTIAERTNVLALNASMQAASAGEAGRSFQVVAEEIQSLAGNAREATGQISSLVQNIQVDTNDTIATMDRTISQVVEGTQLAEAAGGQMTRTQQTTEELVRSVQEIAAETEQQSRVGEQLRESASHMMERTQATAQQVDDQLSQTRNLVDYARQLVSSVREFKLPA